MLVRLRCLLVLRFPRFGLVLGLRLWLLFLLIAVGYELPRGTPLMRRLTAFASSFACFLRSELVCPALLVSHLPAFTSGLARFLRGKFMGSSLLMGCVPAFTRDFALLFLVHSRKASLTPGLLVHDRLSG